jgi:hypothetical protein
MNDAESRRKIPSTLDDLHILNGLLSDWRKEGTDLVVENDDFKHSSMICRAPLRRSKSVLQC